MQLQKLHKLIDIAPAIRQPLRTMQTPYKGIDYSCGRSNIDPETGIHFGVISQNSVSPEAIDDIYNQGEDVGYKNALAAHLKEKEAEHDRNHEGEALANEFDEDEVTQNFADHYESDGGLNDYLYEQDGYKLTGCLSNDLFVLRSPYFTFAQFCSPCVPGAGNLDSPASDDATTARLAATIYGFPRVYCLGHEWFDDGRAPYPVFRVGNLNDPELVEPKG